ncbi:hypothetical protein [Photobacterium kishitanii]|uniref:Uncharacterized protein n=1 Tax=Photobacterium kishitanii TaxID=318456 RepID=A0A0B7JAQ2_9GAMM|nr:hypothetical protein [Photobacterium kishitanii]PSU85908.1 hypothetical protein C0W42_21075 [Photobacterium kishitanii]PSU88888.1 hypothetical protein C9J27_25075 [Photobacterium kishitanii]PSU89987.1 hypothetical protein C0W35_18465 [Photobacterium kishitanii]PSV15929.1 hypothetical protein C0W28_14335 [Photobacterium kishitanii]CEO39069.1 conserved hypothetical protein [Photobacterium kishitanii]
MKILAIPGKMPITEKWLLKILAATNWSKESIEMHRFAAWDNEQTFSVDKEISYLPSGHFDVVITKSIGSLITLKAQNTISWDRLVLIGVAWSLFSDQERELLPALEDKDLPILIIQEKHDPFGSYAEIAAQVAGKHNICCLEVNGDRHQYSDTETIGRLINRWVKETRTVAVS